MLMQHFLSGPNIDIIFDSACLDLLHDHVAHGTFHPITKWYGEAQLRTVKDRIWYDPFHCFTENVLRCAIRNAILRWNAACHFEQLFIQERNAQL
ncbi:hypothetical protein D3C86_2062180 [compost metagenome]